MELIDYVRMLRRRWTWVVSFVLLGLLAGVAYALTATKAYDATSEIFVGIAPSESAGSNPRELESQSRTTLDRMPSYATLVDSPIVGQAVIDDLGIDLTAAQLRRQLSAVVVPRAVVLRIKARSSSAQLSAAIADAAARAVGRVIQDLERPTTGGPSPVLVTTIRPATEPAGPATPNRSLSLALGLAVGLGLGLLTASLRDQAQATAALENPDGSRLARTSPAGELPMPGQTPPAPKVSGATTSPGAAPTDDPGPSSRPSEGDGVPTRTPVPLASPAMTRLKSTDVASLPGVRALEDALRMRSHRAPTRPRDSSDPRPAEGDTAAGPQPQGDSLSSPGPGEASQRQDSSADRPSPPPNPQDSSAPRTS